MRVTWRERLAAEPSLRTIDNWPPLAVDTLARSHRREFLRNVRIVARAIAGDMPLQALAASYQLSRSRISQLLDRCLGGDSDVPPALMAGLVPHRVLAKKQRHKPLDHFGQRAGYAGSFQALLDRVPGLRDGLDASIMAALAGSAYAQRLSPIDMHGEFKRILAEQHWPHDTYPYTLADCGYESVRRYLHRRTAELQQHRQAKRNDRVFATRVSTDRERALRAIQLDEHTLDLSGTLHLAFDDDVVPLRLARMTVAISVDVGSTCVLGYQLIPSKSANTDDILALLDRCVNPWQPLTLTTPGLTYTPGACFPSGLADAVPIHFGRVYLDNAWTHHSRAVVELLCERMGASCNWGLPRIPEMRGLVESLFDYIEQRCGHRAASTTGSHPHDPKRESRRNRKRPPLITFQMIDEALSVILTEYNVTPKVSLGGLTPLERFQHDCTEHFVPFVPPVLHRHWQPFQSDQTVNLHWYRNENRLPHINFLYARYRGPGLLAVAGQEKTIRVTFDRRDIRRLHAFTLDGKDLGELWVDNPWRRFPHTLATRRMVHRFVKSHRAHARDPLAGYFSQLLAQRNQPASALSLLKLYTEYCGDQYGPLPLTAANDVPCSSSERPGNDTRFRWSPDIANRRRAS